MGYKLKTTKEDLYNKGFHYDKFRSDSDLDFYSIRFPVLKYLNMKTTVECEISVELQSGDVIYNVYNYGTNDIYAPFYNREFGIYETVNIIEKNINSKLNKLGVITK